jgi:hypothetical protein
MMVRSRSGRFGGVLDKLFQIAVEAASSVCEIQRKFTMFSPDPGISRPAGAWYPDA